MIEKIMNKFIKHKQLFFELFYFNEFALQANYTLMFCDKISMAAATST